MIRWYNVGGLTYPEVDDTVVQAGLEKDALDPDAPLLAFLALALLRGFSILLRFIGVLLNVLLWAVRIIHGEWQLGVQAGNKVQLRCRGRPIQS